MKMDNWTAQPGRGTKKQEGLEDITLKKALRPELERDIPKRRFPPSPERQVRFGFISDHQADFPCWEDVQGITGKQERVLQMAAQGAQQTQAAVLEKEIETEYRASKGRSGSPA